MSGLTAGFLDRFFAIVLYMYLWVGLGCEQEIRSVWNNENFKK